MPYKAGWGIMQNNNRISTILKIFAAFAAYKSETKKLKAENRKVKNGHEKIKNNLEETESKIRNQQIWIIR